MAKMAKKKTKKRMSRKTARVSPKKSDLKEDSWKGYTAVHIPTVKIKNELKPTALGYALSTVFAAIVFITSILAQQKLASSFAEIYDKILLSFSLTFIGVISGIAEAALWGLLIGVSLGYLYNKFS